LIINYIIIYATGIISKAKIKHIRIFAGSIIGALYAIIYYLINLKMYSTVILKIILSIIIIYISFKSKNFKTLAKQVLLFYLVSFVFGGAEIAIIYMVNSQNITIQNGVLVGNYTIKTVFIGIIVAYITVIIAFNIIRTKLSKKDLICEIEVNFDGKVIKTKAMIDTGNMLKEPITNIPVIVMEHTLFYNIIPKEFLNNIEKILSGDLSEIPQGVQEKYISKLKVIPFSSLGKQNGMLLGIRADGVTIRNSDEVKKLDKAVIGIYDKPLTKRGEYNALVGVEIAG
jgi:stage II sporulation protein GA (sporulation sigma-E factor processing peptidase)